MMFTLTESLINDVQNALENQISTFGIDAQSNSLIELNENVKVDNELIFELPEWTSEDGFELREEFVKTLHAPIAHEDLLSILHSGRGVFRNFRNALKKYPEVEKRWHIYKNNVMKTYINDWYNELREIWGLEKLDRMPESQEESLVYDDFSFLNYDSQQDKDLVIDHVKAIFYFDGQNQPEEITTALYEIWKNQFENANANEQVGFICRSLSDEFAGCITTSPISKSHINTMVLSSFFVPEQFRGLGIATELLTMCLSKLKKDGKRWIILPNIITPEILQPLLYRMGFEKIESGYVSKL